MYKDTPIGKITPDIAIHDPTMGCSGKFTQSNAKFMQNPDLEEDRWLTSDEDLELMRTNSSME